MPYRTVDRGSDAAMEILLITSRQTRRWIIPKGNIDFHMAPHQAAAQEALEEAGAVGEVSRQAVGSFHYDKVLERGSTVMAKVIVYPLAVCELLEEWQEQGWRIRRWFSRKAAADAVQEPELQAIIRSFEPAS